MPKKFEQLSRRERMAVLARVIKMAEAQGDRRLKKEAMKAFQAEMQLTGPGIAGNVIIALLGGAGPMLERAIATQLTRAVASEAAAESGTILANRVAGKAAEVMAKAELEAAGITVLGSNVTAKTSQGIRFIDHLVDLSGELYAVEVKSGAAFRNSSQICNVRFDTAITSDSKEHGLFNGPLDGVGMMGRHIRSIYAEYKASYSSLNWPVLVWRMTLTLCRLWYQRLSNCDA